MNLEWTGKETIPASKATVWEFINDPARVAACLPSVRETKIRGARAFDATVGVAVGPVRGKLKFKIVLEPNPNGSHLDMKIDGGGMGSAIGLVAEADLVEQDDFTTVLNWKGIASMRGPAAAVGSQALEARARGVIATTFENVRKHLSGA